MVYCTAGPRRLIARAMDDFPSRAGEQPVVLSQILMDKVNHGFDGRKKPNKRRPLTLCDLHTRRIALETKQKKNSDP